MAFFPEFHGKITSLMSIFCKENVHSGKNTMLSSPYFLRKKRPVSQKQNALMTFFQIFYEKPPAVKPIFRQKKSILSKLQNIMGQKSRQDALFFFKNVHSLKKQCFHAHILSKYVYSLKNKWLSCIFFKFYMKNSLVVMSKFGKKRQFWLN